MTTPEAPVEDAGQRAGSSPEREVRPAWTWSMPIGTGLVMLVLVGGWGMLSHDEGLTHVTAAWSVVVGAAVLVASATRAALLAEGRRRAAWVRLLPATLLAFIGEWGTVLSGSPPVRGVLPTMDALVACALIMAALGVNKMSDAPLERGRVTVRLLDSVLVICAVVIISAVLVFPDLYGDAELNHQAVDLVFPVLNLLVLLSASLLVLRNRTSRGFYSLVVSGFALTTLGEFVVLIEHEYESMRYDDPQDLLAAAGYLVLALAAWHPGATRARGDGAPAPHQDFSTTVGVFAVLTVAVAVQARGVRDVLPTSIAAVWIVLMLAAGGRQLLVMRDNQRLTDELARELAQRNRDVWDLTRHSQAILDAVGDAVYGVDQDGRITFINRAAALEMGWTPAQVVGAPLRTTLYASDEHPAWGPGPGEGSSAQQGPTHHVDVYRRTDGSSVHVEATSSPMYSNGESRGAVVVFRNIDDRLKVERMKDEFVSVVSHELRTPLTSVRASIEMLQQTCPPDSPPSARRLLEIAASGSNRLLRLVNDILDVERLRSGHLSMSMRPVSVTTLLEITATEMAAAADEAGVSLRVLDSPGVVLADRNRIAQALNNLVGNAIKFSPSGGTVQLGATHGDGDVRFMVRDRGRGIPADKLDAIFEPFEQVYAADAQNQHGTGLGLTITRGIIRHHGGEIWAESTEGGGTTVYFTLPDVAYQRRGMESA